MNEDFGFPLKISIFMSVKPVVMEAPMVVPRKWPIAIHCSLVGQKSNDNVGKSRDKEQ